MIQLASPVAESSPLSNVSEFQNHTRWRSSPWLVGAPTIPNRFQFVASTNNETPALKLPSRKKTNSLSNQGVAPTLGKVMLDGLFACLFLSIIFAISGWMFYGYSIEVASFRDLQFLDFVQRLF